MAHRLRFSQASHRFHLSLIDDRLCSPLSPRDDLGNVLGIRLMPFRQSHERFVLIAKLQNAQLLFSQAALIVTPHFHQQSVYIRGVVFSCPRPF
jgi:hypothetical protein